MAESKDYPTYPVLKGLQKPLEFQGIRGRFLTWAAAIVAGAFFSFVIVRMFASQVMAFVIALLIIGGGYLLIRIKQKEGLFKKNKEKGIIIYKNLFS